MIEFNKPANLDGNVLEAELAKIGITLPLRSITVIGDKVFLQVTQAQETQVQAVLDLL